jgi:hypothetical protein
MLQLRSQLLKHTLGMDPILCKEASSQTLIVLSREAHHPMEIQYSYLTTKTKPCLCYVELFYLPAAYVRT